MNNDLYICSTYYHLLICIVKNIKCKRKNSLIISANLFNNKLANDNALIMRIKNSGIFKDVFVFDYSKKQILDVCKSSLLTQIKQYLLFLKINKSYHFSFDSYNRIYLFNDLGLIGKIINKRKIKYYLLEDGLNSYEKNFNKNKKNKFYQFIKFMLYGYSSLGESKNIISIEVNSVANLDCSKIKFIEKSRNELFNALTIDDKNLILNLFLNNIDFRSYSNMSLLITQPLYLDKLLKSEEEQVSLYKFIIKKYLNNDKVIIKVHPRDLIDYKKYFPECYVIDFPFPLEIINFIDDIYFNCAVSVSSTAIDFLEKVNDKVYLGWDWLNKFKEGELFDEKN